MTLELARQLNAVETVTINAVLQERYQSQPFGYLLVLDFEATCWERGNPSKSSSEIIEFPCILYSVKEDKILSEFQQYVMPTENPKLSSFCTQLTGIQQATVDNGVPIGNCLLLFTNWLREQELKFNFSFESNFLDQCITATWSDWDLGTCLPNECKRKGLRFPKVLTSWIDVRALYRRHYSRWPRGLVGALSEVGLQFEGRQHCGLHDARNTTKLIGKMISDGAFLEKSKNPFY